MDARAPFLSENRHPVLAAWSGVLAKGGEAPAVIAESGTILRSFHALEAEAQEWAQRFAALSTLGPGSIVALQIGNVPEFPAVILALFRRDLIPMPLGRHLGEGELRLALKTVGASALVALSEERTFSIEMLRDTPPRWPGPHPDFLKLTSGTTSAPRAVRFRAEQLVADARQICATMGLGPGDLNYGVIPLAHSYGFSNLVTPLLCYGIPLALSEDRMPRAILNGLVCTGATVFPGMPIFFDKLAMLEGEAPLPRLRLCLSAGAPLASPVAERFRRRFGLKIHSFYGSSECGGIAYDASSAGDPPEGFVGKPMSLAKVEPLPEGTIRVTGPAVGDGYWPLPQPGEEAALADGAFVPSDLVEVGEEGLRLAGRLGDIINVAGRKLNPREVETRLLSFPGVREVVVFGVPSRLRHEEAVACVVGEIEEGAFIDYARAVLSPWQVPKAVWRVPRIAVSERGKISRRALAESYLSVASSRP